VLLPKPKSTSTRLAAIFLILVSASAVSAQFQGFSSILTTHTKPIYQNTGMVKILVPKINSMKRSMLSTAVSAPNALGLPGDPSWSGSTSARSFNNGKFGKFYCWDAHGNLRSSYLYIDIAGKNKRGFKLVFPRHKFIYQQAN
jgi:hypothetical protein